MRIVGPANLPGELATDSSALFRATCSTSYAVDKETKALKIDLTDEVVKGTLVTQGGRSCTSAQQTWSRPWTTNLQARRLSRQAGGCRQPEGMAQRITDMAAQNTLLLPTDAYRSWRCSSLACFIGYYVVWRVTPALHSPLMAVTNAIVGDHRGCLAGRRPERPGPGPFFGAIAVALAAVNIFGGFIVAPCCRVQEETAGQESRRGLRDDAGTGTTAIDFGHLLHSCAGSPLR